MKKVNTFKVATTLFLINYFRFKDFSEQMHTTFFSYLLN